MRTKAEIIARLKELDDELNLFDVETLGEIDNIRKNREIIGKIRALNWVLNKD